MTWVTRALEGFLSAVLAAVGTGVAERVFQWLKGPTSPRTHPVTVPRTAVTAAAVGFALYCTYVISQGFPTRVPVRAWGPTLVLLLLAAVASFRFLVRAGGTATDGGTRLGRRLVAAMVCLMPLSFVWMTAALPTLQASALPSKAAQLVLNYAWLSYEPRGFSPFSASRESVSDLDEELGWIRTAGFEGIVTFGAGGIDSNIAETARRHDLKVILGVWNPRDSDELGRAIGLRDVVDAYVVGHNGLQTRYTLTELRRAIDLVRSETGHPVTTTAPIGEYKGGTGLLGIGDWLFPDAHRSLRSVGAQAGIAYKADPEDDAKQLLDAASALCGSGDLQGRAVMLKMVMYPHAGAEGASPQTQASFFSSLLESRKDSGSDFPANLSISAYGAFDPTWKRSSRFYEWDCCTGVFEEDGRPRPAVREIVSRLAGVR